MGDSCKKQKGYFLDIGIKDSIDFFDKCNNRISNKKKMRFNTLPIIFKKFS
jgi:hypothetical protein